MIILKRIPKKILKIIFDLWCLGYTVMKVQIQLILVIIPRKLNKMLTNIIFDTKVIWVDDRSLDLTDFFINIITSNINSSVFIDMPKTFKIQLLDQPNVVTWEKCRFSWNWSIQLAAETNKNPVSTCVQITNLF